MRALIVIAALGLVGAFGCAAASSEPEEKGESESAWVGYRTSGSSYRSSGSSSSSTTPSAPAKSYTSSGTTPSKSYKSSGTSGSSNLSNGNGIDDPAPKGQGKFGDTCIFDSDCASNFCDTTVDEPFCSN
jgi:hypothetical protein